MNRLILSLRVIPTILISLSVPFIAVPRVILIICSHPRSLFLGKTNAGKSTLFNSLVGQDRAIVSDVHGTTRDFVSEYIYIDGQAYQLIDTAGLRLSNDAIENEGIKRGKELVYNSFIKILVLDATLLNEEALKHDIEPD